MNSLLLITTVLQCATLYVLGQYQTKSPRLVVTVSGNVTTTPGLCNTYCNNLYNQAWTAAADRQANVVQQIIGNRICPDLPSDAAYVQGSDSVLDCTQALGDAYTDFELQFIKSIVIRRAWTCGTEVARWLESHANWPVPIIDAAPHCPTIGWQPLAFYHVGNDWDCWKVYASQGLQDLSVRTAVRGQFRSSSPLIPDCMDRIQQQWRNRTGVMADYINDALQASRITNCRNTVRVTGTTTTGASDGSFFHGAAFFTIQPYVDNTFTAEEACAASIGNFASVISNWPQPIFYPEPGCPPLLIPSSMSRDETFWVC